MHNAAADTGKAVHCIKQCLCRLSEAMLRSIALPVISCGYYVLNHDPWRTSSYLIARATQSPESARPCQNHTCHARQSAELHCVSQGLPPQCHHTPPVIIPHRAPFTQHQGLPQQTKAHTAVWLRLRSNNMYLSTYAQICSP
jgi:hypothetical protein